VKIPEKFLTLAILASPACDKVFGRVSKMMMASV